MRPTYSFSTPVRAGLLTLGLLFAAACGDDSGGTVTESSDGGKSNLEKDAGATFECTNEGKTTSCVCSTGKAGTHTCKNGSYTGCACSAAPDAGKSNVSMCKAGYYTGHFTGNYRPGAFGLGLFGSGFSVQISGDKSFFDSTVPGLAFELTESTEGGGEVGLYKVGGGCLQGVATAVVITQSPFVARLEGNLDCRTGEFTGTLTGYYTLVGFGPDYSFTGPVTGQFDFTSNSLQDGAWKVDEPPALDGNPQGGGDGNWDAEWTADTAPPKTMDPCAFVGPNGEHLSAPVDGGSTTPPKDAGTTTTPDAGASKGDAG